MGSKGTLSVHSTCFDCPVLWPWLWSPSSQPGTLLLGQLRNVASISRDRFIPSNHCGEIIQGRCIPFGVSERGEAKRTGEMSLWVFFSEHVYPPRNRTSMYDLGSRIFETVFWLPGYGWWKKQLGGQRREYTRQTIYPNLPHTQWEICTAFPFL